MSNSTQNDEIKQMERAMDEGFAESEKFLKGMKTPFDKPTQSDWIKDLNYFDFKTIEDRDKCLAWVETLLADARKEVITDVLEEIDKTAQGYESADYVRGWSKCRNVVAKKHRVLATLKEEQK